jgi:integral membrane protein
VRASDLLAGGLTGAVGRYRVMAWVVGAMLLLLCVVAIPLQYAANRPGMANVVAPLHGFLYIVYLLSVAALARHARFGLGQVVALVCAGFVPGLAFYVEHRTVKALQAGKGLRSRPSDPQEGADQPAG